MDDSVTSAPAAGASPESRKARKGRTQHPDRVWVEAGALNRLSGWVAQASEGLQGVALTRSDLLNYLVMSHPEGLSLTEIKELGARYFDPLKHGLWAMTELRAALARGEKTTLAEILASRKPPVVSTPRTRTRKSEKAENSENIGKNAQKQSRTLAEDTLISVENSAE